MRRGMVEAQLCWLLILAVGALLCSGDKIDAHLKRLNKPHLKSIQSPDGDIIDCVHISQQIAFEHPFLKNHTIQMKPSHIPKGLSNEKEVSVQQMWHLNGTCPEETIPVRRTMREDVQRAISIKSFGTKQYKSAGTNQEQPDLTKHEYAIASVGEGIYYGTQATIDVWNPYVQGPGEFSLSQLWVVAGPYDSNLNTIEAGWQVCPLIYGDTNTRFFIYWTTDEYKSTGCYNLLCSAFVQTNNNVVIGGVISPISTYKGVQYELTLYVYKDPQTGNWWLRFGAYWIGYWPSNIFNRLNKYATTVQWGGEIVNEATNGEHTSTDMGNGYFPNSGYGSYFRNVQTVDASSTLQSPTDLVGSATPNKNCYDVQLGTDPIDGWGSYFYYGGPGYNSACP